MMNDELTNRSAQSSLKNKLTNKLVQCTWDDERRAYKQIISIFIILEDKFTNRSVQYY
jgi:hypothetical protein